MYFENYTNVNTLGKIPFEEISPISHIIKTLMQSFDT